MCLLSLNTHSILTFHSHYSRIANIPPALAVRLLFRHANPKNRSIPIASSPLAAPLYIRAVAFTSEILSKETFFILHHPAMQSQIVLKAVLAATAVQCVASQSQPSAMSLSTTIFTGDALSANDCSTPGACTGCKIEEICGYNLLTNKCACSKNCPASPECRGCPG